MGLVFSLMKDEGGNSFELFNQLGTKSTLRVLTDVANCGQPSIAFDDNKMVAHTPYDQWLVSDEPVLEKGFHQPESKVRIPLEELLYFILSLFDFGEFVSL